MGIPERLKEARTQAGLSQAALADAIGATKRSVINWEGGAAAPSAEVLAKYAELGADVGYIVTGERNYEPPPALSAEEQMLLQYFRDAAPAVRRAAMGALLGGAAPVAPRYTVDYGEAKIGQAAAGNIVNKGRRK